MTRILVTVGRAVAIAADDADGGAPTDRRRWLGLAVLAAGLAMIVLDGTIVAVALPAIVADLRLDLSDVQWVNSLYAVVVAALLLTSGQLGDRIGRRTAFILGVTVFVVGSISAALSASTAGLVASRALQGLGGALVMPASLSTVNATFRGRDRAVAFGVWGAVMAGTAALGPLLGGWLTTNVTWPWIFWVNVPVGVVVIAAALRVVPNTRGGGTPTTGGTPTGDAPEAWARSDRSLDLPATLLSALGFGAIILGLIEGSAVGWWLPTAEFTAGPWHWPVTASISIAPVALMLGVAAVGGFVAREFARLRAGRPVLLDLSLFAIPTFAWGNLTALAVAIGEFALLFVLPLYLVFVDALTTLQAGWVLGAMALGAFASGASARHLVGRLGATGVVRAGLVLEILGAAAAALLVGANRGPVPIAVALIGYGVGLGLASAQLTSTVLVDVPTGVSGTASATQSTVRQLGAALGSAIAGSVLATRVTDLHTPDPAAFSAGASLAIWVTVAFLALGLLGAIRVASAARAAGHTPEGTHHAPEQMPREGVGEPAR